MKTLPFMLLASAALWPAPAETTRIPCVGSNGERALAQMLVVAGDAQARPVKTVLQTSFPKPDVEFYEMTASHPGDAREFTEFELVDQAGGFTIDTEQADGSREARIALERSCTSATATGWEEAWQNLLTAFEAAGYRVERQTKPHDPQI